MIEPGPRGSQLVVVPADELPLVGFQIAVRGGSAGDPDGLDGLLYHAVVLARRGAGERDRSALDEALDALGASLNVSVDRDAARYTGLCLERHLDRVVDMLADILARPRFEPDEHRKLVRETRMSLDELRDDDHQLVARFFNRHCVPGHPYSRPVMGTDHSLARIELDAVRAAHAGMIGPENLIIGFAGAISVERARALAARLVADLPARPAPALPSLDGPEPPRGRRVLVVDKPERAQSQVLLGHLGPRYGTREALALIAIETPFGGTFTSRLMQEIRVKRGWSYGAGATLHRSRGAHWFRIHLAPSAEVTPDALALTWSLFDDLAQRGISAEELAFAKKYLAGSLPFRLATARQRLRVAIQNELFGLAADYVARLPGELATISLDETRQVARDWLHPDDALAVIVASADTMVPALAARGLTEVQVVPYDSE
ncbi:M16 family metallopeptidase [Haliangium sp.]|uniref:M16 family metallopeptidase n=1 Tax=Haliangium sp. TaxID=2663208 RepID=UPI003D0FC430